MRTMKTLTLAVAMLTLSAWAPMTFGAVAPVAEYSFGNSFASSVAGAPALTVTDPEGTSHFATDTVFGASRTVYDFIGLNSPPLDQAGLSLNTAGLLTSDAVYTLEVQFKFTGGTGAWRRISDVSDRQSDTGFYVDPSNDLDVYPTGGTSAAFTTNVYHDVFLSVNDGVVNMYLDGSAQATVSTHLMDVGASSVMSFFLDNIVAGGQGEYSSGSVADIRLYNVALGTGQIPATPVPPNDPTVPVVPSIPEPETYALMLAGLGALGLIARRRKSATR